MHIVIDYCGNRYVGEEDTGVTAEVAADIFYNNMSSITKFALNLKGGGRLILGPEALRQAAIMFMP